MHQPGRHRYLTLWSNISTPSRLGGPGLLLPGERCGHRDESPVWRWGFSFPHLQNATEHIRTGSHQHEEGDHGMGRAADRHGHTPAMPRFDESVTP